MGVVYSSSKNDKAPRPPGVVFKNPEPKPMYISEGTSEDDQTKIEEKDQSLVMTLKSETDVGNQVVQGIQDSLLENLAKNQQQLLKMQRDQNKDEVTGLNIDNYLIENDLGKIMKFIH